jgi:hypothetical protein
MSADGVSHAAQGRRLGADEQLARRWRRRWAEAEEALSAAEEQDASDRDMGKLLLRVLSDRPRVDSISPRHIDRLLKGGSPPTQDAVLADVEGQTGGSGAVRCRCSEGLRDLRRSGHVPRQWRPRHQHRREDRHPSARAPPPDIANPKGPHRASRVRVQAPRHALSDCELRRRDRRGDHADPVPEASHRRTRRPHGLAGRL